MQLYFGDFDQQVKPVSSAQSRAYTEALGESLAGQALNREKDLEKFLKSGFLAFLLLMLATRSSSREVYSECFATPFTTCSRVAFQLQKILRQILNTRVFGDLNWRLVRDSFQQRKTHVLCFKGYFQGSFEKIFIFPHLL